MKQSQNAITFLRAQYSAIYSRAYIKGLASAMVLSSAVVGTYAQAATATDGAEPSDNSWDRAPTGTLQGVAANPLAQAAASTYANESYSTLSAAEREAYASAARLDSIKRQSEQQQLQNSGYTQHSTDGSVLLQPQHSRVNTAFAPSSSSDALAATSAPAPEAFALQGSDVLTNSVLDDFAGEIQPLQTEPVQPTVNNVTIGGRDYSNEYNVIAPDSNINITETGLLHTNTLNASGDNIGITGAGQIQIGGFGGVVNDDQGNPVRDPVTGEAQVITDLTADGTANISSAVLKGFVAPESGNGGTVAFKANTNKLNFTDTAQVELGDFTFGQQATVDQQNPPDANITLVGDANLQVSGANISIGKDLTSGDALKLDVTATDLTLGNATQDADSNQNGLGVQSLKAQNVNFVGYKDTTGQEHDFVLRDNLDLNAGTGTGASTGNVAIATGADKALNVQAGEYTHTGNFALNSGTVNIGNTNGAASGNASLVVSGNFTLDNSSGNNTINIVANDANSQARLDLSQAQVTTLPSGGSNYSTTINVGDANGNATTTNAFLQVSNQEQIQQLLGNADGTADNTIKLNSGGQLHVNDDFTIDTSELNSFAGQGQGQNPPTGNTDKGLIFNGGSLGVNTLILTDNKDTNANIGNGIIAANKLLLSGASTEGNTQGDKNFYIESGTIEIDGGTAGTADNPVDVIASADQDQEHKLFIGAGAGAPASANATQGANLNLQGQVDGHYRVATDVTLLGGSTNGAGTTNGPASLAVNNGNWQLQSVTAEGQNNHLNIGANSTDTKVTGTALKVEPNSTLKVNGGQASFTNVELNGADSALELNNERLTVTGSGNFTQGSLRGTGDLAVSGQDAQANFTSTSLKNYVTQNDAASVILDQGGALNFADNGQVELTEFSFDNSETGSGDIHVTNAAATTPEQNSVITGNDLSLSHELASTDLPVDIHATNLSLGSDSFDSQKQAAHGLGVDTLQAQNVSFNAGPSDAFMLKDQLNLRAPNQTDGSTGTGSVSGNVIVAGGPDNGFNVQLGNYTTTDKITLAQGELNVGNDTNTSGNASLALSGSGSELRLDNTAGNNTINVAANGDGYSAKLDLTGTTINAVKDSSNSYYTSVNVGTAASTPAPAPAPSQASASVALKSSDLQALLNDNNIAVNLATSGELNAQSGDLVLDSTDLVNGNNAAATAGQIAFNQGGHLNVAGNVTLQYDGSTSNVINLGQGAISSHSLALQNTAAPTSRNAARANTNPTLTIATGTYNINATQDSGALITGAGQTVGIGDGTTSGSAVLNINGTPTGTEYTIETDLALTSNSNAGNSATVNLNNGNFSANNIYANGDSNSLNIGTPSDPQANPTASLIGQDLELGTDSTLNVSGGEATFNNVALGSGSTLALNNERLTVANGSGDFSQGKLQGTGHLAVVGADANASLQGQNFRDFVSGGAQVTLQEGADLNLQGTDIANPTDLAGFTYDNVADGTGNGQVHVVAASDPAIANSQITGQNLVISHELTSGDDLALDVKADNLTLGSNSYDSASDANGLGVDTLHAQNVNFVGHNDASGNTQDFTLRDQLNLRAPTASAGTGTATGTMSGNVVLAGGADNGLHVQEGNYTQNNNLTLASGDLTVGNTTGLSTDAALDVNGAFALNNQAGNNSITVNGNELGGTSRLDLTDATLTVNGDSAGTNFTTFNVGTTPVALNPNPNAATAQLDVNAEQLQTLLEGDAAGVLLGQNGEVNAQHGSGDLSLDTADLVNGTQATAGKVVFNNGGTLRVDQLTLNGMSNVNIGDGTLDTNTLAVNNTTQGATDAVLEAGNYEVADALSSTNSNIALNQGANLTLGDFELLAQGPSNPSPDTAVEPDSLGGNPGTISSNLALNSGSSLTVQQGEWTINAGQGDLSANGANIIIGAVNAANNAYQVYDAAGSGSDIEAVLTGHNLNLSDSKVQVNTTGHAIFDGINTSNGTGSDITIKGNVTIANEVHLNAGDTITISGNQGSMHFKDNAAHNITANADGSTLNVAEGTFANVFDLQSGGHLKLDLGDQTFSLEQIKDLRKKLLADADASGSVMDPDADGVIHLGGAHIGGIGGGSSTNMTPVEFDKYNPETGEFTPGTMPPIGQPESQTITALRMTDQIKADLADIRDFRTDEMDDILLYDINYDQTTGENDAVTGNVGALMVNTDNIHTDGKRAEIGDAGLSHAYAVSGSNGHRQFISDQTTGELLGANVQTGGSLYLENGGYIGDITLEDGNDVDDRTALVVNKRNESKPYGNGDDGITYINSVSGGENTAFEVHDVTKVTNGPVQVAYFESSSNLDVLSGDLTVTDQTLLAANSHLNVSGNTSFTGITTQEANSSITASGNGSFNGDTTLGGTNSYTGEVTATGNSFTMLDGSSLDAASAQITTNEIALGGTITLDNGGTFSGNTVTLGSQANISTDSGDLSFTAASGDFNLGNGAQLAADNGTLRFTATAGNIYQGQDSKLNGKDLSVTGQSVTLAGNNNFTGSGSITATGTPDSANQNNGLLYVDGDQHFAQGADFNGYNISLGNTANVTADSGDLAFTTTTAGSGSIGLASGSSVNAAGGNVSLEAANGTVFQEQGSNLNGTNLNVTGQSVSLAGNNSFTGSGSISATGTPSDTEHNNGLLYVDGTQNFAQGANFSGGNISLGNTANVTAESGDLTFTTTAGSGSIGLASGSSVNAAGGNVSLEAANGTVFQEQGSSLKGTDLMVTGQSVSLAGNNTFTGSGSITATGTPNDTEHNNGLLYVDGTQNFAQGADFNGYNISLGNTANVTADSGDLTFTTTAGSGSIGLASGSNVSASGGSVILDATNGTVFQEQGSSLKGTDLMVTGQSVSLAGNNTFTGHGSVNATDTESGSIYIGGEQNFDLGASFTGTKIGLDGKVTLGSGDGIFSGNTVTLGTNANINATAGNLDFTSSSGDLGLASGSQGTASGDINLAATNGNVIQAQGSSLNGTNFTVSGQNVTLAGNNTFTGSGSISAADATNGTVTLGGNQSFALGAEVTGNTITLAGGNISASSGDINFNGSNVNLQGGTLQGTNINVSGDTIAVDGTNNFSGSTTLSSTQDIKLNSGSVVNASGDLFFAGNVIQDSGNTINAQNVNFDNTTVQSGQGGQGGQGSTTTEPVTSVLAGNNNFEQASFTGNYELRGSNNIDTLDLGTVNGGTDYVLQVGTDTGSTAQASLEVNTLHLNGNTLYADPAYGEATTLVAIKNNTGAGAGTPTTPVLDGDLILGKNVAAAWGADKAALQQEIAAYQTNGSLNYNTTGQSTGVGTILVVNQPMHVADGSHIVLNSDPNTTGATDTAAINQLSDGRVADLALSDQSQLMINLGAVGQSEAQNTPAITFDKTGAVITAESGAKIVLSGEIYDIRNEIDIFADADTESGSTGVELVGSDIQVSTANGLFTTTLLAEENGATQDNVGHVKLKTTEQQIKSHFYRASDPVVDTLVAYKDSNPNADGRSAYLNSALQVAGEDGTAAETAARMAVYGGAVNTALAVNNTTSDAIARRTGIGHGAPGGTFFKSSSPLELWASPVYSRVESDGLAAEGVDYGTEIDLTGLNAGVELKLNADTKLGAMVNWGQGSADGTGIASGVSNDFDYYGLGAYAATKIQNFNLVGDVSYSKVSNDISSNNKVDSINTSVDTTNLSLGLTGRLDLDVNGIQVSPHAGVRYQRIEMDDYSVNSRHHGRVVDYRADQINLLSMPVGVMITNDYITRSGWQLKPAIDFTATFNVGDNDANGVAVWTGSNLSTPVSTEVLDPFTFGVNVGFSVRKGNFSAGTGINYTSSENTSDFGIQANLRYDF